MAEKIYKGKNLRIFVDEKSILHSTECSFSTTRNFEATATKDTEGNVNTPGNYEWSLTANALFAEKDSLNTAQTDFIGVMQKFKNADRVLVQFTTDAFGEVVISGNCYISGANITASTEGSATGDFAFTGDGDFEIDTVASVGPLPYMTSGNIIEFPNDSESTFDVEATNTPTSFAFVGEPIAGISINSETGVITCVTGQPEGLTHLGTSVRITNANGYKDYPLAFKIV